jgi:heat shock protein HslJ
MAEETAYLAALEKAATYKIFGNSLEIRDADGNTLVTFARQ